MPKAAVLWFDAPTDLRARRKRELPSVAGIAVEVSQASLRMEQPENTSLASALN